MKTFEILKKCRAKLANFQNKHLMTKENNKNPPNLDLNLKENSNIIDEHFFPRLGLDLEPYIKIGDVSGVHDLIRYYWAIEVISDFHPINKILDIECGAGYGSYLIAKKFPHVHVTGVDYDNKAIQNAQNTYLLPNIEFILGDACRWEETIGKDFFFPPTSVS